MQGRKGKLPKNLNLDIQPPTSNYDPKTPAATPKMSQSPHRNPFPKNNTGVNGKSPSKASPKRYNGASPYNRGFIKPKEVNTSLLLQIDKQSQSLDQNNIHTVLELFIKQLKEKVLENQNIPKIKNKKIRVNLCLEKNKLCCTAIGMIVDILLQFKELIKVGILRLHMNCIKDRGATKLAMLFQAFRVKEIHLSHNYITEIGLTSILESVQHSPQYNKKAITPLWMRLEYNIINSQILIELLLNNQDDICLVPVRGVKKHQCNIHYCASNNNGKIINIHLPYIKEQKQLLRDLYSTDPNKLDDIEDKLQSLLDAESNSDDNDMIDRISVTGEIKIEVNNVEETTDKVEKKKKKKSNKKKKTNETVPVASSADPLLIVLDTCTVIQMSNKSSLFSFENLLKYKEKNALCDIKLILIDTVFQQLDERKKETNNGNERYLIKQFLDHYLIPCREENILHFIHPIELEDEVRARGGHVSQRNFRKDNGQFDSDGMILDCIYFLIESSNKRNNILFITNDRLCKSRALMNRIPSDSLTCIESFLSKNNPQLIDKSSIISCLSNECLALLQTSPLDANPFSNSSLSRPTLLSELQSTIEVIQCLSQFISQPNVTSTLSPELQNVSTELRTVANAKVQHLKDLLSSHQRATPVQFFTGDTNERVPEISELVDKIQSLSLSQISE